MKQICYILILLLYASPVFCQYYLKGEIKDEADNLLSNVKIILRSSGYTYYSGNSGGFGIMSKNAVDSITVLKDGFQSMDVKLRNNNYEYITLKLLKGSGNAQRKRLVSITKDLSIEERSHISAAGETYSNLVENDFISAQKYAETGFAISIDKASYSNVRRFLNINSIVPPDAVRIEEMLNYFNFGYKSPAKDSVFGFSSYVTGCPWNPDNQLLFLKVCARQVNMDSVPASNLVFLIDISGSMDMPNRLPLLKSAFKLMVNNLRAKDTVSIVVYGSTVGVWMQPTSGKEKLKIQKAIEDLNPGGATAGASGIATAYAVAKRTFINGGNNRVILATDGDFNVGQTSEDELEKMISLHRHSGIYLTCLGVGMGNYKDSKLEVLAKKGNGNFAYLDNEKEAEKVLVKEFTQTLYTVADEAFLTIRFNPAVVKQYRLIGFDNKLNAIADSTSELEGGEVGSGHTLLAMVEFVPAKPAGSSIITGSPVEAIAGISVNYNNPKDTVRRISAFQVPYIVTPFGQLEQCYRFAASVVMFAFMLKKSKYWKNAKWNDIIALANSSYDEKDSLQKEFLALVEKAKKIYSRERKKN